MTGQEVKRGLSNVAGVVCLVGLALVALVVLAVMEKDSSAVVGFIGAAVVPTVTIMLYGSRLTDQVAEVRREVNGRFSEALSKIPPADRPEA